MFEDIGRLERQLKEPLPVSRRERDLEDEVSKLKRDLERSRDQLDELRRDNMSLVQNFIQSARRRSRSSSPARGRSPKRRRFDDVCRRYD